MRLGYGKSSRQLNKVRMDAHNARCLFQSCEVRSDEFLAGIGRMRRWALL